MPNSLINETSPYLLQHANNPVNWFAWNETTLQKAKDEQKMLLISIGYAACHWCHVMEHQCFEDEDVAKIMNENFVCIKVDREERPDVDQVYMNAAYLINGNGGWPLNALAMPDGKPFFAGTYFPKENWIKLLQYFASVYKDDREKLLEQAENLSKGIREIEEVPLNNEKVSFQKEIAEEMFYSLQSRIDLQRGGTKGAMKFPMPSVWEFLLHYHYFFKNKEALEAVEITLNNMANGGIFDQVGGGFSRYATDPKWHAPHFEKMLYDNGQLVSLFSKAYKIMKSSLYKKIVFETLEFVERELTSPEGGFYSALDADSEGKEGKYYVWTQQEINDVLGEDAQFYSEFYGITGSGNWEDEKNIPDVNYGDKELIKSYDLADEQISEKIKWLNKKLFNERQKRVRPATDDKILTSWNALMAIGYLDAYKSFGEEKFLTSAKKNIDFLLKNVCTNNSLFRSFKNNKAAINGFLDDYAFFITALIEYYQVSFEEFYLKKALALTNYTLAHFFAEKTGMFYYTNDLYSDLIARKMEITDNVIPSSGSQMAKNLLMLSYYFENQKFEEYAVQQIKNILADAQKNVNYYSNWAQAILMVLYPPFEVAIMGKQWKEKLQALQKHYLPGVVFLGAEKAGTLPLLEGKESEETMIFVCKNKTCKLPVREVEKALEEIQQERI
jgi:uncharacterized protein YyaL (SSP411 family)